MQLQLADYLRTVRQSALAEWATLLPWQLTCGAPEYVRTLLSRLSSSDYLIDGEIAVHRTATLEPGAVLKGPLVIGPHSFIATGAYLRGGCWLGEHCIIGPGAELKTSFVMDGSKLAHFNFVGDSVLGSGVNLEAGSIVCNYRNEREDKQVKVRIGGQLLATGCDKFGALIGDGARVGANAVLAPGAILQPGTVVRRLQLFDGEVA